MKRIDWATKVVIIWLAMAIGMIIGAVLHKYNSEPTQAAMQEVVDAGVITDIDIDFSSDWLYNIQISWNSGTANASASWKFKNRPDLRELAEQFRRDVAKAVFEVDEVSE